MNMNVVPDLYELAFMPGQFRCPECGFQWSIQTLDVGRGRIGTTEENRQTPDCPNDGTRMVNVTYREQLEAYAGRLKEELDNRDALRAEMEEMVNSLRRYRQIHDDSAIFQKKSNGTCDCAECARSERLVSAWRAKK